MTETTRPQLTLRHGSLGSTDALRAQLRSTLHDAERALDALRQAVNALDSHIHQSAPDPAPALASRAYTYQQAATILGVSRSTVQRMAADGTLEKVMIGGVPRIPRRAVDSYLPPNEPA